MSIFMCVHIRLYMCAHTHTHDTEREGGSRQKRQEASKWHRHTGGGGTKGAFVPTLAPAGGLLPGGEPEAGRTGSAYSLRGKFQSAVVSLKKKKKPLPSTLCPLTKSQSPELAVLEAGAGRGRGERLKARDLKCPSPEGLTHSDRRASGGDPLCGPAGPAGGQTRPAR